MNFTERSNRPWDNDLSIRLPNYWIDPKDVTPLLPPYYANIARDYSNWLEQPHPSLEHLSWTSYLDFLYRPLNPTVNEEESCHPTTYFVYESIWTFFAGMVTGELQPQDGLDPQKAAKLRKQIVHNTAEVMQCVAQLATGSISFDQEHNLLKKTYKLLGPNDHNHGTVASRNAFIGKEHSLLNVNYTNNREMRLNYLTLDNMRFYPGEINSERSSYYTGFRLERSRPAEDERRLMLDWDISKVFWEKRADGRILPKPDAHIALIDEYFGKDKHHVNLAIRLGNDTQMFEIDAITRTVMTELGLTKLLG